MDREKVALNLKTLRQQKGVTVLEVANAVDVTPQAITQYETGYRVPRDEVKERLAKYYKKSVGYIFFS